MTLTWVLRHSEVKCNKRVDDLSAQGATNPVPGLESSPNIRLSYVSRFRSAVCGGLRVNGRTDVYVGRLGTL